MASREPIEEVDRAVRLAVFHHFIEDARAPDARQLASRTGASLFETRRSLQLISDAQDIVLAPASDRIWMAHPFSAVPTEFQVFAGGQRYWANCAVDALEVPLLLGADADIRTHCADCRQPMRIEVRHGQVSGDGLIHFLVPPSHFRDNIAFTCATTLLFRAERHVERWCVERCLSPGSVVPVRQCFELVRRLAGGRLSSNYRPFPPSERLHIYRDVGLADEFWQTYRLGHAAAECGTHGSRRAARTSLADVHDPAGRSASDYRLTGRELEVLDLLAAARLLKQIADQLHLSPHTVDTHVRNIYSKLQVHSRAAAITAALRAGVIRLK